MIGAEQNDCVAAAAVDALRLVCSLSVAAGASEDLLSLVDSGVHYCEFDREDRPNTAGCLSAGSGDWASGRVDVPGSVPLPEPYESQQRSAATPVVPESSSAPFSFQAMIISLSGKTLMLDVSSDTLVLSLVEDVAELLGLPATSFYLTLDSMSLAAEGVGSGSVTRTCARLRGGMQPVNGGFSGGGFGGGGDFGQWTCTNPQCRANRCWLTKTKCFQCGAPRECGLTQDPGRPTYPPPGWQPREQHHPGRPAQSSPSIAPTMSKEPRLHAGRRLRRHLVFPLLSLLPRCRLLNFSKGTWMVSSF